MDVGGEVYYTDKTAQDYMIYTDEEWTQMVLYGALPVNVPLRTKRTS